MNMKRYSVKNICGSWTLVKQPQTQDVTNRQRVALNSVSIDASVLQGDKEPCKDIHFLSDECLMDLASFSEGLGPVLTFHQGKKRALIKGLLNV